MFSESFIAFLTSHPPDDYFPSIFKQQKAETIRNISPLPSKYLGFLLHQKKIIIS